MEKFWIGLMVSRTLSHDNSKDITRELTLIFGKDLLGYKVVCTDQMSESGEYYIFVRCADYDEHVEALSRCHFITGVIPSKNAPYQFTTKEVAEFLSSAGHKDNPNKGLNKGDVVLVKDGYLKGLYGIITKETQANKKYKVFFGFYVRQFSEILRVTSLEFIGKVSGHEFTSEVIGKPIVIGAHVVHHRKLHRPTS
jgi:hypothetical protein